MIPTFLHSLAALIRQLIANGKAVHITEQTAKELELLAGLEWMNDSGHAVTWFPERVDVPGKLWIPDRRAATPADLALGWLLASKPEADTEAWVGREVLMTGECDRAAACAELTYLCCAFGWEERDPVRPDTWAQHTVYAHRGTREGARAAWDFIAEHLPAAPAIARIVGHAELCAIYARELEAMK